MSEDLKALIVAIQDNDKYYNYVTKLLDYTDEQLNDLTQEIIKCVLALSEGNMKNKNSMIRTLMNLYTSLHIVIMNRDAIGSSDNHKFRTENITGGLYYTYPKEGLEYVKDVTDELLTAFSDSPMDNDNNTIPEVGTEDIEPTHPVRSMNSTSRMDIFNSDAKPELTNKSNINVPSTREEFSEEDIRLIDELVASGQLKDFYYYNVLTNKLDYLDYFNSRPGVKRRQKIQNLVTAMEGRYKFFFAKDGNVIATHSIKKYEFCSLASYLVGTQDYYLRSLESSVGKRYKFNRMHKLYELSLLDAGGKVFITREQFNFTVKFYEKLDKMIKWFIENLDNVNNKFEAILEMFKINSKYTSRDAYKALVFSLRRNIIHNKVKLAVMESNNIYSVNAIDILYTSLANEIDDSDMQTLKSLFNVDLFELYDKDYKRRAYDSLRYKLYREFEILNSNMLNFGRFKYYTTETSMDFYTRIVDMLSLFGIDKVDIESVNSYDQLNNLIARKLANKFD